MRLEKYLSDAGLGTRTEVKKLIRQGKITVNQQLVKDGGFQVNEADEIRCCGELLSVSEFQYFLFHKPAACVTAHKDAIHKTVMDYIPQNRKKDLSPVGRLDLDTEGLLLVTNDGELLHLLTSPKKGIPKQYFAKVKGKATEETIALFQSGLDIGDEKAALPAVLEINQVDYDASINEYVSSCFITVEEGRFHEVKRLFLACNLEVIYLKRLKMGKFTLDESLKPGEYRELTEQELEYVKEYKSGTF